MNRVEVKNYKNKRIILIDFSNLKANEIMPVLEQAKQVIAKEPENSVLTLSDLTNMGFNPEVVGAIKDYMAHNKPYVKAGAVVGGKGLVDVVLNGLQRKTFRALTNFNTREEALDWLVEA